MFWLRVWPSPYLLQWRRVPDNDVLCIFAREHFPSHLSTSSPLCTLCHVALAAAAGTWGARGLRCKAGAPLVSWRWGPRWEMTLNLFPIMLPGRSRMINIPLPSDPWRVFLSFRLGLLGQSRHTTRRASGKLLDFFFFCCTHIWQGLHLCRSCNII